MLCFPHGFQFVDPLNIVRHKDNNMESKQHIIQFLLMYLLHITMISVINCQFSIYMYMYIKLKSKLLVTLKIFPHLQF